VTKIDPAASPCTGKCGLHPALPWCAGCGRTLAEIAAWPDANEARKRAILAALPGRIERMKGA
jgi:predicted Fe-S protein YdhL (DUF1289 family)